MARTQLERLSTLGYQLMSGYEAEFFVYTARGATDSSLVDRCLPQVEDLSKSKSNEIKYDFNYQLSNCNLTQNE